MQPQKVLHNLSVIYRKDMYQRVEDKHITHGDNKAYCNMFDIARQGTGIDTVEAVARDIIEHSADEYELTDVMETIINTATYISVEEQEGGA